MRGRRTVRPVALVAAATALALGACDLPRDPGGTLERVRGETLRVGVSEAAPWIARRGEGAVGPEADLVRRFADEIGARIEWRWGGADDHLLALERYDLDVVAAGLTEDSPWKARVAFTRPWRVQAGEARVLAVAPGENRTLVALERVIGARRAEAP